MTMHPAFNFRVARPYCAGASTSRRETIVTRRSGLPKSCSKSSKALEDEVRVDAPELAALGAPPMPAKGKGL